MSDPTRKSALDPDAPPQWGVLVSIRIDGAVDCVLTLPPALHTEAEVEAWITALGLKMSDPNTKMEAYTKPELHFLDGLNVSVAGLVASGMMWKVRRHFTPEEVAGMKEQMRRQVQ